MRLYESLHEAESEIRRDLAKGTLVTSSRVQQRTGLSLKGRERMAYEYAISAMPGIHSAIDLAAFGKERGFPLYVKDQGQMVRWLNRERQARLKPTEYRMKNTQPTELLNSALETTIEGNHPSYTYTERLTGAMDMLELDLKRNPDTRRAFWPIFHPADSLRAAESTRIPCSIGYQPIIRQVGDQQQLIMFYLERSCDFDNFWLSDVWLARQFQLALAQKLGYLPGQLIHFIISFHSFAIDDQEIY